jgi:hypothetical protein
MQFASRTFARKGQDVPTAAPLQLGGTFVLPYFCEWFRRRAARRTAKAVRQRTRFGSKVSLPDSCNNATVGYAASPVSSFAKRILAQDLRS